MGLLLDFLTLPLLGPPRLVCWLGERLAEEAEGRSSDEKMLPEELFELQQLYEAGEIDDDEYDRQEKALLERLGALRESRAQRAERG